MKKINFCSIGECMIEIANIKNNHFIQSFAGDTLNFSAYLDKKKIKVDYLTSIGKSKINKNLFDIFRLKKISPKLVNIHKDKESGLYLIKNYKNGEKQFYYWRENSAAKDYLNNLNYNKLISKFTKYDYVYFSGITLALLSKEKRMNFYEFIKLIKQKNIKIVFDLNIRLNRWSNKLQLNKTLNLFLPLVSILFGTGEDMKKWKNNDNVIFFNKIINKNNIQHAVYRKNASYNYAFINNKHFTNINKIRNTIIDSSGAGDGFNAAYISEFVTTQNAIKSLKSGHNMGSKIVMKKGAIIL
mgnify:FL=1